MILLVDVTRFHGSTRSPQFVLDRVSLRIERGERIGILAAPGAGKSTLARIITGQETPDEGHVIGSSKISWPMGLSSAFHPALSAAENISLIASLWNLNPLSTVARVEDFARIGDAFHKPMATISPGLRSNVATALSLSTDFDFYLADDMNVSADKKFREKAEAALTDRLESSGLIMLSRHARQLKLFATKFFVLADATLIECSSADEADDVLTEITNQEDHAHEVA